jgi:hypothetical protein
MANDKNESKTFDNGYIKITGCSQSLKENLFTLARAKGVPVSQMIRGYLINAVNDELKKPH